MNTSPFAGKVLALVAASFLIGGVQAAETKVAIIDLQRVFTNYWKTVQANIQIEEEKTDIKKKTQSMSEEYTKANQDYKKLIESSSDQAVSSDERERRKGAAEKKLQEIKDIEQTAKLYQSNSEERLSLEIRHTRDRILGEIRDLVDAKGRAGGFSLVINVAAESANQVPVVLYNNGQNDISDDILSQLNAGAPPGVVKTDSRKDKPPDKSDNKTDRK